MRADESKEDHALQRCLDRFRVLEREFHRRVEVMDALEEVCGDFEPRDLLECIEVLIPPLVPPAPYSQSFVGSSLARLRGVRKTV